MGLMNQRNSHMFLGAALRRWWICPVLLGTDGTDEVCEPHLGAQFQLRVLILSVVIAVISRLLVLFDLIAIVISQFYIPTYGYIP